jgi:plasmid stabilization system protein ParE
VTGRIYRLVIRPEAKAEVAEAAQWYDSRERGLGRSFVHALKAATAALRRNPFLYQIVLGQARRLILRRFPYCVIYEIQDSDVVVLACHHEARDPGAWEQRIT